MADSGSRCRRSGFLLHHFHVIDHLRQFSGAKLWDAIRGANYWLLLLSIITIYSCYAVRALRWQRFQAHVGQASFWNIYAMNLAGFSALFLLGRAAEPVRPLLISRRDKLPLADTFGIYALERILDAACTAVLAAAGLLVFESSGHLAANGNASMFEKAARTAGTFFSIGAIVAISGLVYLRFHGHSVLERKSQHWLTQHGWKASLARILLGFSRGVQTIRSWGDLGAAIVLSLLSLGPCCADLLSDHPWRLAAALAHSPSLIQCSCWFSPWLARLCSFRASVEARKRSASLHSPDCME